MRQDQLRRVTQKFMISCLIMMFAGAAWFSPQAQAFEVFENDAVRVQFDSVVSYGLQWRVQSRDKNIIGLANGGTKHSVNMDDGNLNYDTGLISNAIKMTSELDIDEQDKNIRIRKVIRLVAVALSILGILPLLSEKYFELMSAIIRYPILILGFVEILAVFIYLRRLALRIPYKSLAATNPSSPGCH